MVTYNNESSEWILYDTTQFFALKPVSTKGSQKSLTISKLTCKATEHGK